MQESYRIFISHIHEEKELALALQELIHEQLHNNFGGPVQCFLSSDRFQLDAGEDLTVRIKEELSQSDIVLLMLSPQSLERHWVNLKGGAAWMTDRIVIPIHYSGLTVANIPRPYVDFNAIDLETEAYHLLRGIGKRLRPTLTPPPLSDDDPAQKKLQDEIARNSQRLATRTAEAQKKDRSVAPGWQRALRWAPLGLMTIAAVSLALVLFRKPVAESPVLYAQISIPEDLTLHPGDFPVISPDGGHVVLAGSDEEGVRRLWLRSLDRMTFEEMPGTEHAVGPFWSPDSRFVGFFAADSGLKKVSISGGPPLALAAAKHASDLSGSWGSGGAILFAPSYEGPLYRVSSAGGEAVSATVLEPSRLEWAHRNPYFLPDGEHFLYSAWSEASQPSVRLGNLSSGESRLLPNEASSTWYAPPGYSLFNRATTLMAQPFDADKQELTGDPVPIVEGVGRGFATPPYFSASVNGILIYRGDSATSQLTWWDRTGTRLGSPGEPGAYTQIALSPDEKRVSVETRGGGGSGSWSSPAAFSLDSSYIPRAVVTRSGHRMVEICCSGQGEMVQMTCSGSPWGAVRWSCCSTTKETAGPRTGPPTADKLSLSPRRVRRSTPLTSIQLIRSQRCFSSRRLTQMSFTSLRMVDGSPGTPWSRGDGRFLLRLSPSSCKSVRFP